MNIFNNCFIVFSITISASFACADDLIFCTDNWENQTNADGTGSYLELVKKVFEPDHKVVFKFYPWPRAQEEFKKKNCTGIIAENRIDDASMVRPQYVLDQSNLTAFFIKSKGDFKGEEALKTKKIAWNRGYGYDKLVSYKMAFSEVNDVPTGYKMLEAGRFDILIDYEYDFEMNCKKSGVKCDQIGFAPSGIIEKSYVVFHRDGKGEGYAARWDQKLAEYVKNGTAAAIYKKYGVTYPAP